MKFSIIICTYNAAKKLPKTLDSILAQTYKNYEIVIIDGASTDGTQGVIKEYEHKFEGRLRWISEKDEGLYNALNKGLKLAKGDFLNVVGAGDWLEEDALKKAVECIDKNPNADAVYGKLRVWDKGLKNSYLLQSGPDMLLGHPMQHPALYYKRELHDTYGFYSENYKIASDYLFCMKAFLVGNAKAVAFDEIVDNFITDGISSTNTDQCDKENMMVRQQLGLNPLVSIIVPSYNQASYISETLNSVLAQTYINWECIVVDDGSVDETPNIVKHFLEKDERFKYFRQNNQGPSTARNNGILKSRGEYILPLDSDDKISSLYLQEAVSAFLWNPLIKIVYCNARYFGERKEKWNLPDYLYENILFYNMIFCSAIYRRRDYDKTKGYNANMKNGLEDWDFWLSLLNKDDVVYKIPKTHFFYRIKNSSHNTDLHNNEMALQKMYRQVFFNHKEKYKGIVEPLCVEKYMSELKERIVAMRKDEFFSESRFLGEHLISRIIFAVFSPKKFINKYFNKLLNGKFRQPARKIWHAIRLKKIS